MRNVCIFDGPVPSEQPGTVCLAHNEDCLQWTLLRIWVLNGWNCDYGVIFMRLLFYLVISLCLVCFRADAEMA